jgi:DNA-binding response OmpR family regulator
MSRCAVVIEDDEAIGSLVAAYLEREGFAVAWERSGGGGLAAVEQLEPSMVVLDVGLPDVDGFEVCRRVRRDRQTPILILTARDEEVDRIVGLELGADDYMVKPFSPRELVARVRAILRRAEPEAPQLLELGDVLVDRRSRTVTVAGEPVVLRTLEFELLAALAEGAGRVVTREELLAQVWGTTFPGGTRTIDVHVAQLRKKLARPELITTVRGTGYRAVVPAAVS